MLISKFIKKKSVDIELCPAIKKKVIDLFQANFERTQLLAPTGFVHKDICGENILLDANNNVKVSDFGLTNNHQP